MRATGRAGPVVPVWFGETVFGALAGWFAVQAARQVARRGLRAVDGDDGVHPVNHLAVHGVMAAAMAWMYAQGTAPAAGSTAMAMHAGGAGSAPLALGFLVVLAASAVAQLDTLGRLAPASLPPASGRVLLAPRLELGCHVAMCLVMAHMLAGML